MVFFNVTGFDGTKVPVNSETIRYCDKYDREAMRREISDDAKRDRRLDGVDVDDLGGEVPGIDPELVKDLRKAFASVDVYNAKIYFLDGTWFAARETREQIRQLANEALSDVMARHTIEAAPPTAETNRQQVSEPALGPG